MGRGALSERALRSVLSLLKDPRFCALRKTADERPLTRAEFGSLPMPEGVAPDQAWEVLNALRRHTAVELPYADGKGRRGWYYLTRSILDDLDAINRHCHEGSWLDSAIRSHNTTYFLVEAHIGEARAVIQEDGLSVGYEKAREVLLSEREPESREESLLLNGHRAIWELDRYLDVPCTPRLIAELNERVMKGVGPQPSPSAVQESELWKGKGLDADSTLELVSKIVNEGENDRREHPLLRGMAVHHLFMSNLPLPDWNAATCSLVMKLMFKRLHLPALASVPVMKLLNDWKRGIVGPPHVMASIRDAETLVDGEVDYTVYVGVLSQLTREGVEGIEEELRRAAGRDEAFSSLLHDDLQINHRQRQVLQIALKNPETVFEIEAHRRACRVAYATARADLVKLADLGFLKCVRKGHAFKFHVVPGLRLLLTGDAWD